MRQLNVERQPAAPVPVVGNFGMLDPERCWQAVLERDAARDGEFVFGVVTTGVYCRPSCPARRPNRENTRFFATPDAAEATGLRACKRCRPRELGSDELAERMARLCAFIREQATSGEALPLETLAREAAMSPSHLQRTFKALVGVSPRRYVEACRLAALKGRLKAGDAVTDAIYEAGFGSSSRVYERAAGNLGMTPREYRAGGRGLEISYAAVPCALGLLMVGATDRGLCFIQFGDDAEEILARLRAEYPQARIEPMAEPHPAPFSTWMAALKSHLEGHQPHLDLPLAVRATAFEQQVWTYLQSIPYGERRSYGEVATAIGRPRAARAVAKACAANRTALLIPCHRVIRGDGEPGGYRWGMERKAALLAMERGVGQR